MGSHLQFEGASRASAREQVLGRLYRGAFAGAIGMVTLSFAAGAGHVLATRRSLPGLSIDPLLQARELLDRGDLRASIRQFRVAAAIDPGGASDMIAGLDIPETENAPDSPEVRAALLAKERRPQDPQSDAELGRALLQDGRRGEATLSFLRAIRLDPRNAQAHAGLGDAFSRAGRSRDAAVAYIQALRLDPGNARIHNSLGLVYASVGDFERASEQFGAALSIQPNFSEAAENLARAEGDRANRTTGKAP